MGDICGISDIEAANRLFMEPYTILGDCGFFYACGQSIDTLINPSTGETVEIRYCEVDWAKVVAALVFILFVAWRLRQAYQPPL